MNTAALEANLIRGYEIYNIGEDFLRECAGFNVDGYCHEGRQPGANHSNLIQHSGGQVENCLYYGLKSRNIGIVGENPDAILIRNLFAVAAHEGFAFVNVDAHAGGNAQIKHKINHCLIYQCTFGTTHEAEGVDVGGTLLMADDPPDSAETTITDLSIRGSFCKSFSVSCTPEPAYTSPTGTEEWADNNHFIDNAAGTNNTTGESEAALFVNPVAGNWHPALDGTLVSRVTRFVPCDVEWNPRDSLTAVGAYASTAETGAAMPAIADKTITFQFGKAVSVLLDNSGSAVTDVTITDPTHAPTGISVSVSGTTVLVSGTPVRS
jgi:hypothetical protein